MLARSTLSFKIHRSNIGYLYLATTSTYSTKTTGIRHHGQQTTTGNKPPRAMEHYGHKKQKPLQTITRITGLHQHAHNNRAKNQGSFLKSPGKKHRTAPKGPGQKNPTNSPCKSLDRPGQGTIEPTEQPPRAQESRTKNDESPSTASKILGKTQNTE